MTDISTTDIRTFFDSRNDTRKNIKKLFKIDLEKIDPNSQEWVYRTVIDHCFDSYKCCDDPDEKAAIRSKIGHLLQLTPPQLRELIAQTS
jgi:hypothetical protein